MSTDELDDSKAEPRITALGWLANATGSSIAYSGSVPVDLGENEVGGDVQKTLSYANGYAETDPDSKNGYVDLAPSTKEDSPFVYFMDGSRMAWKIAEFRYGGKLWPIVAGQIGVAYCKRENRRMKSDEGSRIYRNVLSLPQAICGFGPNDAANLRNVEACRKGINEHLGWNGRVPIDTILTYADKDDDKTNLAISRIQALMRQGASRRSRAFLRTVRCVAT